MSLSKQLSILGFVGMGAIAIYAQPANAENPGARSELTQTRFFYGDDLSDADLSNTDLSGAFFYGSDLSEADLSNTDLSGAFFYDSDLSKADLSGTDLSGAFLYGSDLSKADLSNTDLGSAFLYGSDLSEADLSNADLGGADFNSAFLYGSDLSEANLSNADLQYAFLYGSDLSNANLSNTELQYAFLYGSDLSEANLSEADLQYAFLYGSDLSEADLSNTDLQYAFLYGSDLSEADLSNTDLQYAFSYSSDLSNANLSGANLNSYFDTTESQLSLREILQEITSTNGTVPGFCSQFSFFQDNFDCGFLIEVIAENEIDFDFDDVTVDLFEVADDTDEFIAQLTEEIANSAMPTNSDLFVDLINSFTSETPDFTVSFPGSDIESPEATTTPESSSIFTLLAIGSIGLVTKLKFAKRSL